MIHLGLEFALLQKQVLDGEPADLRDIPRSLSSMKELFGTVERHNTAPPRVDQESGGAQFHSAALFPFYPALPSFHCTEFTADSA